MLMNVFGLHFPVAAAVCCLVLVSSPLAAAEPTSLIVAHRGLLHSAPENTLSNFRACLELRIGFEFDVRRTSDGHLVAIHDDTVDRTTSGRGTVLRLTLGQIRGFDAGSWFDPRFAGEKVPTVEEVIELLAVKPQPDMLIAVDLKDKGVEEEVVQLAARQKVLHRLLFIGRAISEPAVRRTIRKTSQVAHVAALANNPDEFRQALSDADADWVYLRYLPSDTEMAAVRQAGKRAFVAGPTVSGNVPENWQTAARAGVAGILTDFPLELATELRPGKSKP
jgi:glycerophosphoryl diester phosphodiesterase